MIDMINPNEVRQRLEALANTFESSDPKSANRLRNLRTAVGRGNNSDAWAASDIQNLINPEQIIERYKRQRTTDNAIAFLEWLRNILIFTPLVVSWYGISQAVQQYSVLIKSDPTQITQPFLYLWQNGFGNRLAGWQTLGTLATIDAILLGLLLLLTLLVYSFSNGLQLKREQKAEELQAELTDTLSAAALCMTTRHWQQPTNFVNRFDESSKFFKEAMEHMLARIETLAQSQHQDHQAFSTLRKDLVTIMSTVSAAVNDLRTSNDALRRSMSGLTGPVTDVSTHLATVGASAQEAVTLYRDQIRGLQAVLGTLNTWGTNLQNVLGQLDTTVQNAMAAGITMSNNIDTFTQREKYLADAMGKQLLSQEEITKKMVENSAELGKVVSEIYACAKQFNALNVQVDELTRRLAKLAHGLPI
jgi:hypothetical protein